MTRLPGNRYRARQYATSAPPSMVSTSAPPTTITVLSTYRPIDASSQARAQLPNRGDDGSDHGLSKICASVLSEESTAHSNGNVTSTAQTSSTRCTNGFLTRVPPPPGGSTASPARPG